jgi:hypothetical protein
MIKLKQLYSEIKPVPAKLYNQLYDKMDDLMVLSIKYVDDEDEYDLDIELSTILNSYDIHDTYKVDKQELMSKLSIDQAKELLQKLKELEEDYG